MPPRSSALAGSALCNTDLSFASRSLACLSASVHSFSATSRAAISLALSVHVSRISFCMISRPWRTSPPKAPERPRKARPNAAMLARSAAPCFGNGGSPDSMASLKPLLLMTTSWIRSRSFPEAWRTLEATRTPRSNNSHVATLACKAFSASGMKASLNRASSSSCRRFSFSMAFCGRVCRMVFARSSGKPASDMAAAESVAAATVD
mmetsp:Transcript_16157/g.46754  ORF Transcript_16157/g.46754 Transcript_16157/m.46754 type:complete len:207 (+) Transcript_16157:700-1320(+)